MNKIILYGTVCLILSGIICVTGCDEVDFIPANIDSMHVSITPAIIPADGISQCIVTLLLLNDEGDGVTDQHISMTIDHGTVGAVLELGSGAYQATVTSSDYAATATLIITIEFFSGSVSKELQLKFGEGDNFFQCEGGS